MAGTTATPLPHSRTSLWGEGPIWDHRKRRLLYVDIEGHKIVAYDPEAECEQSWDVGERVGTVVPRDSPQGDRVVYAGDTGFHFFDLDSGENVAIADPEPDKKPQNRFNDGKCDPAGRMWAGTISTVKKRGDAALYMLDTEGNPHRKFGGVTNSNGVCWSHDARTMFYIDTPRKAVLAFDFDNVRGDIGNERVVIDTAAQGIEGSPDGMAIDAAGKLWIAICHGGCVVGFDPDSGCELDRVSVPGAVETTACAFGGKGFETLFITTGQKDSSEVSEPDGGRLFAAKIPGTYGVPSIAFAG